MSKEQKSEKITKGKVKVKALKAVVKAITKAKNDEKSTINGLGKTMLKAWEDLADNVMEKADSVKDTEKSVDSFLSYVDKEMGKLNSIIEDDMQDYIDYLYKFQKNKFVKDNDLEPVAKANLPEIEPSIWIAKDEEAISSVTRITKSSTGKFYKGSVQKTVYESVKKNILESPLTHEEAVGVMKKDLAKALKISKGKLASKVVPKGFKGTADQYFSGLAENAGTLTRTSSSIYSVSEVGGKYIVVRSVRSSRTCAGCLAMDGTKYKTADAVKHLEKILAIDDVSDYGKVQPSFHFTKTDKSTPEQLAQAKELKESGAVYLAPFHFRCECYMDMG